MEEIEKELTELFEYLKSSTVHSYFGIQHLYSKYSNFIRQGVLPNYCDLNRCMAECSCVNYQIKVEFQSIMHSFRDLINYHSFEEEADAQLELYYQIKDDKSLLRKWVIDNKKIGTTDLFCFFIHYLDNSPDINNESDLLIYSREEINIFVPQSEFKSIIKFLDIFNELYFDQQIYDEGILADNARFYNMN